MRSKKNDTDLVPELVIEIEKKNIDSPVKYVKKGSGREKLSTTSKKESARKSSDRYGISKGRDEPKS